ncbi:MAG TPA: porin, partial [Chthonomonadaceae bacterium]|nr:porin [Chthonomonadaceae bacterium]
ETRLGWGFGATRAEGYLSLFQFQDPLPNPVDPSTRIVSGFAVKQILSPGFGLTFRYQDDRQQNNYAVPYSNLDQHTRFWNVAATGKWGPGFATLNYSNLYYSDHTGVLPNMMAQNAGLSYLWNVSNAVSLEASYSHLLISQHDAQQSKIDTLALTGDFALGSATDLDIHLQQRNLSLPTVQSAFTRAQSLGTASLSQRWKSWRAQVGVRLQDDDRVNGDQTYVDVPKWSTVEGRISGRLMPDWRLTVKGYTQALFNPPPAITMDPRSLYFNGRNYLQVRLEGGPPDINYYLVYTHQDNRNSARSTEVQTDQYTAGSIWQLSPTLSLFGEYHHEVWSGHTDLDVFPTLSDFLPDSTTGIVELTWNLPHLYLSASYTGFAENNANPLLLQDGNAHGSYLTLSGHYRFPRGYQLGLSISPWAYHDNTTSALDYNAAIIMVTGSARF